VIQDSNHLERPISRSTANDIENNPDATFRHANLFRLIDLRWAVTGDLSRLCGAQLLLCESFDSMRCNADRERPGRALSNSQSFDELNEHSVGIGGNDASDAFPDGLGCRSPIIDPDESCYAAVRS
jgi:hypothetical protein